MLYSKSRQRTIAIIAGVIVIGLIVAIASIDTDAPVVTDCPSAENELTDCAIYFGKHFNSVMHKYTADEWDAKYRAYCYREFELCEKYCGPDKC